MQYILTEEEYNGLLDKHAQELEEKKNIIQKLCTEIADTKPIKVFWEDNKKVPWGCVITRSNDGDDDWYCDECPAQDFCPSNQTRWSK